MSRLFPATGAGLLHSQEITFCPWTRCFASTHRLYLQQIISPYRLYLQQIISSTEYIFNRLYLQQIDYLQQIIYYGLSSTDYIFNRLSSTDYLQQIIFNRLFQRQEGLKGQDMGIGGFLVCSSCVCVFLLCQGWCWSGLRWRLVGCANLPLSVGLVCPASMPGSRDWTFVCLFSRQNSQQRFHHQFWHSYCYGQMLHSRGFITWYIFESAPSKQGNVVKTRCKFLT